MFEFKTLKDVKKILIDFFNSHGQLMATYYCDDPDYNAIDDKLYSNVQLEYLGSPLNVRFIQYRFNISVNSLYDEEETDSALECHDFGLLILKDLISFLAANKIEFSGTNAIPYTDDSNNRGAGVTTSITIQVPLRPNECIIPNKDI